MKMAGDALPLLVTTGVGVGVLAGVVSGVCYLILNGLGWSSRVKSRKELLASDLRSECASCGLFSCEECASCELPVCKNCATDVPGPPRCLPCARDRQVFTSHLKSGNSFLQLLRESFTFGSWSQPDVNLNHLKVTRPASAPKGGGSSLNEQGSEVDGVNVRAGEVDNECRLVRDFLQQLAERLTGGSLDDVSVSRMYQHPDYLPLTESESASSAHARLQHLVQRAIEEALRLPPLFDYSGLARDQEGRLPEFSPKTYEDLLATAILNKVINRYQHDLTRNNGASSSGVHSGSSSPGSAEGLNESTVSAGRVRSRGRLRNRGKTAAREDSADPSSLEPMSQDDYGLSDSSGRDSEGPIVIEECSVERSVTSTDDEDFSTTYNNPIDGALSNISFLPTNRINFPEYGGDIVDMNESDKNLNSLNETDHKPPNGTLTLNSEIYANNNSWEENWLFQKKKIKTAQSIPVPMLIPNSNTDYRALIGDRDAEDTTDLSEAGSEAEENSTDIKQVLVNSKTIIGGKNPDILLAMIDQDANDDDMNKNGSIGNDDLPKPLISEHKDENDNKTISSKLIDSETNHKFVTADVKYIETFDELFFKREVPEQLESPQISKDNFRHFLRNLENEEPDEQYEVIMDSFVRVPSIMDEEMFATEMVTEATNLDVVDLKEEDPHDSLGNHQQESEYTETVAIPVQRHVDSLRRQHDVSMHNGKNKYEKEDNEIDEINDTPPPLPSTPQPSETKLVESLEDIILVQLVPIPAPNCLDNDENDSIEFTMNGKPFVNDSNANTSFEELVEDIETKENDEKEVPGSVAEREHKKWLNAVPMANNPYSPEAIQNRLNKQNKISVFEHMKTSQDVSPPASPKIDDKNKTTGMPLQVVLGEEITDYKRYGRDYYINESKKSAGARKRLAEMKFGSLPNESNENKNAPLLRSTSETTAPKVEKEDDTLMIFDREIPAFRKQISEHQRTTVILPEEEQILTVKTWSTAETPASDELLIELETTTDENHITKPVNWCGKKIPTDKSESAKMITEPNDSKLPDDIIKDSIIENAEQQLSLKSDEKPPIALSRDWYRKEVTQLKEEQPLPIYKAEPVIMHDSDNQFEDKFYEFNTSDHNVTATPLILDDANVDNIVEQINGQMLANNETLDQSDSISSIDDSPKVYNVQLGKVMTNKAPPSKIYNYIDTDTEYNSIILEENKFESIDKRKEILLPVNNIKSWKSTSDVYWDKDKDGSLESKIEQNLELPCVKDLARKFFVKATIDQPSVKPKRRISKELLENQIISKTFSASHTSLKQPQYMHSLTARSISKEFRDELKLSMPAHTNIHPGGSKNITEGANEPVKEGKCPSRGNSPVPEPGSLRNKLAFFERLNKHDRM